ncbi:MAG: hypothetical protein L6R36_004739 [Xanthoria steineri]|nr:MAG: hypothetical protein L6R36_004739 [Xanthoria steineri]
MNSQHSFHIPGTQTPPSPLQRGRDNFYAKWPPVVERVDHLGYVEGPGQHFYSHDIGRSSEFGDCIYYLNGDTMCNDAGISSNTYQLVLERKKATEAMYVSIDDNGFVAPLIDNNEEETQYLSLPENKTKRIAFWCFGGIVEISPGLGWVWYQKFIIDELDKSLNLVGVGLARITQDKAGLAGQLSSARIPGLMFRSGEPLFGSFSTLVNGDMVYLWGQKDSDVFLARVPRTQCQHRHMYQYWNGANYVSQITEAAPVLQDYQQGQIFQSDLFGPHLWLFVGCTRWADSQVIIGLSCQLEGPWDVHPIHTATGIKDPVSYRYCIYPHPWATNMTNGKLLVTWCDHWPGGVIAAKIRFATVGPTHWAHIPLSGYSHRVIQTTMSKTSEVCSQNGLALDELTDPHRLSIRGIDQQGVERAVNMIRDSIAIATKEELRGLDAADAAAVGAPRASFGERLLTKIIKHACG